MSTYSILVFNTAPGCTSQIEQQLTVTGCTTYIVRLTPNSNALGPFDVYLDTNIYYSGVSRNDMLNGVVVDIQCGTPTPTPTPSITPTNQTPTPTPTNTQTPTITPTNTPSPTVTPSVTVTPGLTPSATPTPTVTSTITPTPTITPSITPTITPTPSSAPYSAYVFPEPQDSTSLNDLGQYMFDVGATWYGWGNSGVPAGPDYAANLARYVAYSGWTGSVGNFVTNVSLLSGGIRQASGTGTDSYGCPQNQYTFGSIPVAPSSVNAAIQYTYTVWVPLAGVGGIFNNMTVDVGLGSACSTSIIDNGVPDAGNAAVNVIVPSGCAIPSGTYRVLWMNELYSQPGTPPLTTTLWVKGDTKSP